MWNIITD